jgi:hypothetical protein
MPRSLVIIYHHSGEAGCLLLLGGPKSLKIIVHHIPEDCNFHQQCCENLKTYARDLHRLSHIYTIMKCLWFQNYGRFCIQENDENFTASSHNAM